MKKAIIWIGSILVVLGIILMVVVLYANSAVTAIADREIRKHAETMQDKTLDYKNIDKQKMPQQAMARNAGIINFFLSMIVPPNNPRHKGHEPEHYTISVERDTQKNFAIYLFSPVIDGIKQTVLPVWLQKTIEKKQKQ